MRNLRGLHEAMDGCDPSDPAIIAAVRLRAAARLVASLLEPCPTCDGTGELVDPSVCPDCSGTGLQVSRQAIERGAAVLYTKKWGPSMSGPRPGVMDYDQAEAVLRALLLGDTDGDT